MPSQTFLNLDKDKQKKILEGASEVFLEKSFDKAKVVDICKKSEIPRVTFYSYFESLEDVYIYTYRYFLGEYFNLDTIKNLEEDMSFYNKLIDYFVNIIDSELGLRTINEELEGFDFQDKMITNYMIALGVQYKSGVISKQELMIRAGEMLSNIQK